MHSIINWIKSNKIASLLILFVTYLLFKQPLMRMFYGTMLSGSSSSLGGLGRNAADYSSVKELSAPDSLSYQESIPQPDIQDRMMTKNANQSLYVKDVRESIEAIESYTKSMGGYTVSKSLNDPQESSHGYVTLRIPSEKLEDALAYFGEKSVRVVYESIYGNDITDQYVDTKAQLDILEKTKEIFVGLLDSATSFDQILRAQKEILSVQSQIDQVKGQIEYMEATAKMSLVSLDLSTDELELGYTPVDAWRPSVIFKLAVRSMVANARKIGNVVIWVAVYSVIWVPALVVIKKIKKRRLAKQSKKQK